MGLSCFWTDFYKWKPAEYAWFLFAVLFTTYVSLTGDIVSGVAAVSNVICVLLCAKGRNSNYIWGVVGVLLYGYSSWITGFYGNALLNLVYYLPLQFYGYYSWRKNMLANQPDVEVRRLTLKEWLIVGLATYIGSICCVFILKHYQDPAYILDGFTTFASIIAMWLMTKRYAEQWVFWIVVDVVTTYMWTIAAMNGQASWAFPAMWLVFTINAIFGIVLWWLVKEGK